MFLLFGLVLLLLGTVNCWGLLSALFSLLGVWSLPFAGGSYRGTGLPSFTGGLSVPSVKGTLWWRSRCDAELVVIYVGLTG